MGFVTYLCWVADTLPFEGATEDPMSESAWADTCPVGFV